MINNYKKTNPLLSITIPTWNRGLNLNEALSYLLPQLGVHGDDIELIISDNASQDNTREIVESQFKMFPDIYGRLITQNENTGFYGNFHNCISQGKGKYLWLLSDDDYVLNGTIDLIMEAIKQNQVGAIFLNNWRNRKQHALRLEEVNKVQFFNDGLYRHSLISTIIYSNRINGDDDVFKELKGNALIGYAVFLKAVNNYDRFAIIRGKSLITSSSKEVRFNALGIFTYDLSKCIELAYLFYPKKLY